MCNGSKLSKISQSDLSQSTSQSLTFHLLVAQQTAGQRRAYRTPYRGALLPVQLSLPIEAQSLHSNFRCHCTDCRRITATMSASDNIIHDRHHHHVRGEDNLTTSAQCKTNNQVEHDHTFSKTCGALMYRVSDRYPVKILRIGTFEIFHLHGTRLKPMREIFPRLASTGYPQLEEQHERSRSAGERPQ